MFKVHFLNTVWSDAAILEKDGHFAFIDTASKFYFPMVEETIKRLGIKKIDFIFLTHFHSDHYGNITNLLENYEVGALYLREYTNAEAIGGSGEIATEEYNATEMAKSDAIKDLATKVSKCIILDGSITNIDFNGVNLDILNPIPFVKFQYNDENSPMYHVRKYSENNNSCGIFIKYNNHTIYIAGDITDSNNDIPQLHRHSSTEVKRMYEKYGIDHIEVYKTAHHGGPGNNNLELLELIKAETAIITNTDKWLDNWSTIPNIKLANPNTNILKTDLFQYDFDFTNNETKMEKIDLTSLFITLGKE